VSLLKPSRPNMGGTKDGGRGVLAGMLLPSMLPPTPPPCPCKQSAYSRYILHQRHVAKCHAQGRLEAEVPMTCLPDQGKALMRSAQQGHKDDYFPHCTNKEVELPGRDLHVLYICSKKRLAKPCGSQQKTASRDLTQRKCTGQYLAQ